MTLLFRKNLAEKIVNGEDGHEEALEAHGQARRDLPHQGRLLQLPTRQDKGDSLYQQRLGDMTLRDALNEVYASLEEFRREWEVLYGRWEENEAVWVVEFEHIGPDRNP